MSTDPHRRLHEWFATHSGVTTLQAMLEMGFSERAAYRLVGSNELKILQPGVFLSSHWPLEDMQRMIGICLRNPNVAIGWHSAAALWGFRSMPKNRLLHVVAPHGSTPALRGGVIVHRSRQIDPVDVVQRADGLRLTSPPRTLMDIADSIGDIAAVSVLEQLVNSGRGTIDTHFATLVRLAHSRRPGTATMDRVLASRPAWSRALQSELEVTVLAEIRRQGLPDPEIQFTVVLVDGRVVRLDFAWPRWKTALEVDHPYWHAGDEPSHRDKRRDRLAAVDGWQTCRLTDFDVHRGLSAAVAEVGLVLARRAAQSPVW